MINMTEEFFRKQMQIIINDFGNNEYTPNRVNLIWSHCKDLPEDNFARIVKHFCLTKPVKYPPLPNDFIEEANRQRNLINSEIKRPISWDDGLTRSDDALEKVLKGMGASNLSEAVQKAKLKLVGENES